MCVYIRVERQKPLPSLYGVLETARILTPLLLSQTVDEYGREIGLVLVFNYKRVQKMPPPPTPEKKTCLCAPPSKQ